MSAASPTGLAEARVERARTAVANAIERAPSIDLRRMKPAPSREPWSLHADALKFLVALVHELRPAHILELGCGLSTRVLAWAAADAEVACRITSLDNDPEHAAATARRLEQQELHCPVELEVAPLVLREVGGEVLPTYLADLHDLLPAPPDLVLIDGPPAPLGGREGTLYRVLAVAQPGTVAILDDADRPDEAAILERWQANLGPAVEIQRLDALTGGMAAIVVRDPVPEAALWEHRLRTAADELSRVAPHGSTVAVVDDGALESVDHPFPPLWPRGDDAGRRPRDGAAAVQALERVRGRADHVAVLWPANWWLEEYAELAAALSPLPCIADGPLFRLYRLSS